MAEESTYATAQLVGRVPVMKVRTVVVDDSDVVLDAICAVLELKELNDAVEIVGKARNGVEALQTVAESQPDLVLMDVNMPVMDGPQAATFLAKHFPEVKVVLMSSSDTPKVREQCRSCGSHAFTYKLNFREEFALVLRTIFVQADYMTA